MHANCTDLFAQFWRHQQTRLDLKVTEPMVIENTCVIISPIWRAFPPGYLRGECTSSALDSRQISGSPSGSWCDDRGRHPWAQISSIRFTKIIYNANIYQTRTYVPRAGWIAPHRGKKSTDHGLLSSEVFLVLRRWFFLHISTIVDPHGDIGRVIEVCLMFFCLFTDQKSVQVLDLELWVSAPVETLEYLRHRGSVRVRRNSIRGIFFVGTRTQLVVLP